MNIVNGKHIQTDYDEYVWLNSVGVISVKNNKLYADVGGRMTTLTDTLQPEELNTALQEIVAAQATLSSGETPAIIDGGTPSSTY